LAGIPYGESLAADATGFSAEILGHARPGKDFFTLPLRWRRPLADRAYVRKKQEGCPPSPFSFIAQILANRFCEGTPTRDKTMVGKPCIKPPYMAADLSNPLQDGEKNRSIKTEKRPAAGALNVELVQRAARNLAICYRT
jgi:hypothetical protein